MSDSRQKITQISRKNLFNGYAGVEEYRFKLPENGEEVIRTVITRPNAAAILLINQVKQSIVLIRQFRAPVYHNTKEELVWEIPAGVLESDENPETGIIRETLEETGYQISNPALISAFYPTVGILNEIIYLYYDFIETKDKILQGGGLEEENEFLDVVELSFADALNLLDTRQIIDGKTIIALYWLKNKITEWQVGKA